ncbi:MAG TPA: DUF131 domain-containing protein, partial [Magnetospirillaceae bacterium]|nr:DUF131 domain-containing protein [Magnetospirillaceae bacterium]
VLAAGLLVSSAALGWAAWERGELELYLFLVFPVLKAGGMVAGASMLLGFAALVVFLLSFWTGGPTEGRGPEGRASVGGVILIGPVPIVLGSDRRTAFLALVVAAAAMTVMILFLIQ